MNEINRIMNEDPLNLSAQDKDELIKYYRLQRMRIETGSGGKPKKHEPIPNEDIDAAVALLAPKQKPFKRRV